MLCPGDLALPEISFCRGPAGLSEAACGVIVACSVFSAFTGCGGRREEYGCVVRRRRL